MQVEFMRFDCNQECIEHKCWATQFSILPTSVSEGIRRIHSIMYNGNPIRPKRSRMLRMQFFVFGSVCNTEPRERFTKEQKNINKIKYLQITRKNK